MQFPSKQALPGNTNSRFAPLFQRQSLPETGLTVKAMPRLNPAEQTNQAGVNSRLVQKLGDDKLSELPEIDSSKQKASWVEDKPDKMPSVEVKPPGVEIKKQFRSIMDEYTKNIQDPANRQAILADANSKLGLKLFKQLLTSTFIDKIDTLALPCITRYDKYIMNTRQKVLISSILDPSYPLYISVNDVILANLKKYNRQVNVFTPLSVETEFIKGNMGYPLNIHNEGFIDVQNWEKGNPNTDLVYLNCQYTGSSSMLTEILRSLYLLNKNKSVAAGSKFLCLVSAVKIPQDVRAMLRKVTDADFDAFTDVFDEKDAIVDAFNENKKLYVGGTLSDAQKTFNITTNKHQLEDIGTLDIDKGNIADELYNLRPITVIAEENGRTVHYQIAESPLPGAGKKCLRVPRAQGGGQNKKTPFVEHKVYTIHHISDNLTSGRVYFSESNSVNYTNENKLIMLDNPVYPNPFEGLDGLPPREAPVAEEPMVEEPIVEEPVVEEPVVVKKVPERISLDDLSIFNGEIELLGMCGNLYEYLITV